jgi:glycosyltransferase involved in cell wall biosynthesis
MVGRLWKQKNPNALVVAAIELLSSGVHAHFVLIGDGELRAELVSKVKDSGYFANIHFLGWRTDTPKLLSALDIFVLPSLWEGMPLAILEAQAKGLPCIVSNIQGNNHLVIHGETGLLFELDNSRQLEQFISRLIDNNDERLLLGELSRRKILSEYDIEKRIQTISNLYLKNFRF